MFKNIFRACKTHFKPLLSRSVRCRPFPQTLNFSKDLKHSKNCDGAAHMKLIKNADIKGHGKYWKTTVAAVTGLFTVYGICRFVNEKKISQMFIVHAAEEKKSKKKKKDKDKHGRKRSKKLTEAIERSRDLCQRIKDETGSPGLTIAVSVDGKTVWSEGMGFADLENRLPCGPETIFRIASISKPIAMAIVAKLWENGDLDLDKPVQFYVPSFPEKTFDGKKVTITTRHLVSHLGGVRHYYKDYSKYKTSEKSKNQSKTTQLASSQLDESKVSSSQSSSKEEELKKSNQSASQLGTSNDKSSQSEAKTKIDNQSQAKVKKSSNRESDDEMLLTEYYIKKKYSSVKESMEIFKNDPLVYKPGTQFLYTTHGWTVVSAVVEEVAKIPFEKCMKRLFRELGMDNTFLEENEPLIYNRGRHYIKNKRGRLQNAPYVDLSYKWAGGGMVSNVLDLVRFGNIMLYSYQMPSDDCHDNQALPRNQEQRAVMSSESEGKISRKKTKKADNNISDEKYDKMKIQEDNTRNEIEKENKSFTGTGVQTEESVVSLSGKVSNKDLNKNLLKGYLKPETMKMIWQPVNNTKIEWSTEGLYGMGWGIFGTEQEHGFCKVQKYYVSHTGGAVGASSVLLILPSVEEVSRKGGKMSSAKSEKGVLQRIPPQGVVVAILVNMTSVGLNKTALEIAKNFESVFKSK